MKKMLLAVSVLVLFVSSSFAATTPIKISIWDKIALPPADKVVGLELGLGSHTKDLTGVSLNLILSKSEDAGGIQYALVVLADKMKGIQSGFVSISGRSMSGIQLGFYNGANTMKGIQYGVINNANNFSGLQLGLLNMTNNMYGLQIGLINYIKNSSLPFMVLINLKF
jgi:hypothetical protein